jgi:hypothetical protein
VLDLDSSLRFTLFPIGQTPKKQCFSGINSGVIFQTGFAPSESFPSLKKPGPKTGQYRGKSVGRVAALSG